MTEAPQAETPKKKSDLKVRAMSAVVMLLVAGTALWLGGWVWIAFVALVGLGILWEWCRLAREIASGPVSLIMWMLFGLIYIGAACAMLAWFRAAGLPGVEDRLSILAMVVAGVIGTDIGAYFAGRTFGGPKIAPKISPSKTWSGLVGGMFGAALAIFITNVAVFVIFQPGVVCESVRCQDPSIAERFSWVSWGRYLLIGAISGPVIAILAQTGDFFESWMKRRAGVKDSSNLIPGHGGLFDRMDGLLAVSFVCSLFWLLL